MNSACSASNCVAACLLRSQRASLNSRILLNVMPAWICSRDRAEDFEESAVDDLEAALRVEQAKPLRHVVERGIETQIDLPEIGLLFLRMADVAANDDKAAVPGRALADPQPAPVGQFEVAGRRMSVVAPGEDAPGMSSKRPDTGRRFESEVPGFISSGATPEQICRLRIGKRDAIGSHRQRRRLPANFRARRRAGFARSGAAPLRDPSCP